MSRRRPHPRKSCMDCLSLYQSGVTRLTENDIDDPEFESSFLLATVLDASRSAILLNTPTCSPENIGLFNQYIERRCQHEPFAYIVGSQEFWSLNFRVTPDVLIPRPETELIIEQVQRYLANNFSGSILDCGTGSGILPITLATIFKHATFTALDVSHLALKVAGHNSALHGVQNRVNFLQADFMDTLPLDATFDVIVSNPPYVALDTFPTLQRDVVDYEPHLALDGKGDGFDIVKHLLTTLGAYLSSGGHLFMEIGFDQEQSVYDVLRSLPFYGQYKVINDYAGLPRMVHAVKI